MAPRPLLWALKGPVRGATLALSMGLAAPVAAETIVGAQYGGPTTTYSHGILGDAIEFTELVIETEDWAHRVRFTITLPADHVFEDIEPRLWDITGDGKPEVVVIETDVALGGSLAVYDEGGKIGETPHIGRPNRWLAPVGAADFDGDGLIEVAFVDRPHLAKVLRIYEWNGVELVLDAELDGLTNHRIGEDFFSGGVRDCGDGPEMVTANSDWSQVMVSRLLDGDLWAQPLGPFSQERLAAALDCRP